MSEHRYPLVLKYVSEHPWAVLPSTLAVIQQLLRERAAGIRLSEEEIQARLLEAREAQQQATPAPEQASISVIPVRGVLAPRADLFSEVSGASTATGIQDALALAVNDETVKAIVLDIDSPGGVTDLIEETGDKIRQARDVKPVIAAANTMAASAAYWLGAQATEFVVTPSGHVGSIGVYAAHEDVSALHERLGVKTTLISAGRYKVEGNPFEPLTDDARAAIQEQVDAMYGKFVAAVATGRGVSEKRVRNGFGEGRLLDADAAVREGLVDDVEPLDATLARWKRKIQRRSALSGTRGRRTALDDLDVIAEHDLALSGNDASANTIVDWRHISPSLASLSPAVAVGTATSIHADGTGQSFAARAARTEARRRQLRELAGVPNGRAHADTADSHRDQNEGGTTMAVDVKKMTISALRARAGEIDERLEALRDTYADESVDIPEEIGQEMDELFADRATVEQEIAADSERRQKLQQAFVNGTQNGGAGLETPVRPEPAKSPFARHNVLHVPEDVFDIHAYRRENSVERIVHAWKEGAKRVIAEAVFFHPNVDEAHARKHVMALLHKDGNGELARHILAAGSPAYETAYGKSLMGFPLNNEDAHALHAALSETAAGGDGTAAYPVPITIDPTIIPTSNGVVNPLRQIASVRTITGLEWRGVTSAGVTITRLAEGAQTADNSFALGQPTVKVTAVKAFVPFSIEVSQDWAGMMTEIARVLGDAKDVEEAQAFTLGNGTDPNPGGVIATLAAGSNVASATAATFAVKDLYALKAALPPRFRPNASWMANDAIYSLIRQFDSSGGANLWTYIGESTPERLIGKPAYESSVMVGTTTTGSKIILYGDFNAGFMIVDRIGMFTEVIPHVFGANQRPTGQRGVFAMYRNSSVILTSNAFRLLVVA